LIFSEAVMIVGRERDAERRLDHRGEPRLGGAHAPRRPGSSGSSPIARRSARLLGHVVARRGRAEPLARGSELEQRVVGRAGTEACRRRRARARAKRNVPFSAQQTP
jgi:hypothetical protein